VLAHIASAVGLLYLELVCHSEASFLIKNQIKEISNKRLHHVQIQECGNIHIITVHYSLSH